VFSLYLKRVNNLKEGFEEHRECDAIVLCGMLNRLWIAWVETGSTTHPRVTTDMSP